MQLHLQRIQNPTELVFPQAPSIARTYKNALDDFEVEELSAFDPDGRRGHFFLWVEKRDLSTLDLVDALAESLRLCRHDIGTAGLKDTHAITRQWVSVPSSVDCAQFSHPRAKILRVERNSSKLKTGELLGNRFRVVLRGDGPDVEIPPYLPNYFGRQRFGASSDTHLAGLELLRQGRADRRRLTRLQLSAAQSALFNAYLAERVLDDIWHTVIDGDRLLKTRSGGTFYGDQDAAKTAVQSGHAVIAGPMFGARMAPASDVALTRERAVLSAASLTEQHFARLERVVPGTRRALWVEPREGSVASQPDGSVELRFVLPAGAYATVLLDAVGAREAA